MRTCSRWQRMCSSSGISRLRLRAGRASKSRLRGQFDKAFTPLNRARCTLVPRRSASRRESIVLPFSAAHDLCNGRGRRGRPVNKLWPQSGARAPMAAQGVRRSVNLRRGRLRGWSLQPMGRIVPPALRPCSRAAGASCCRAAPGRRVTRNQAMRRTGRRDCRSGPCPWQRKPPLPILSCERPLALSERRALGFAVSRVS